MMHSGMEQMQGSCKMASGEKNIQYGLGKLSLNMSGHQAEDKPDLHSQIDQLSPTTQESLGILLRSISKGEAQIDYDASGNPVVEYKQAKKVWWDASNANVITVPKTDNDIQVKVDACLELVGYFKSEKPPSGVILDKTKISLSPTKVYREGHEFQKTKSILGSGNSAGDIIVVKDTKTGTEHAHKTMMISVFCKDEIRCWVDMSDTGYVPCLYLFNIVNNKVSIHMEILKDAKTLRNIIDDQMRNFYVSEADRSLVKPFSLFVLDGALEAVSCLHDKGWAHRDLHAGNVMLQKTSHDAMKVKILDFGMAGRLERPCGLDFRSFQADIAQVLRLFSGLYTGQEFDNVWDIQHNWQESLGNMVQYMKMSASDREELFCLVDAAMKVVTPADVDEYRRLVKEQLQKAMGDTKTEIDVLKRVAAILFPEEFVSVHPPSVKPRDVMDCFDSSIEFNGEDSADSVPQVYHDIHDSHDNQLLWSKADQDLDRISSQVTEEFLTKMRLSMSISSPR